MAADKGLRQRFLTLTSSVGLRLPSDVRLFLSHSWPHLTKLQLRSCNLQTDHIQLLVSADLPLVQALNLSGNSLSTLATKHLATNTWPLLTKLTLRRTRLSGNTLAHLITADWPALRKLDLSLNARLTTCQSFMPQLARAPWTSVQSLDLSGNLLSISDAQILGHLQWPQLTRLCINVCFGHLHQEQLTEAVRLLAAGDWPHLKTLVVSYNSFTAASTAELAKGRWPELQDLGLRHCERASTNPEFVPQLTNAPWTALQHLDLGSSHLIPEDANFLGHLQETVSSIKFDFSFVVHKNAGRTLALNFATKDWPHLQDLDVSSNNLPAAILLDITRGARLQELMLGGNDISGWSKLAFHNWRYLGMLDLQGSTVNPEELCRMLHSGLHNLETLFVFCKVTEVVRSRPVDATWPSETHLDMQVPASLELLNSLSVGCWPVESLTITHDTTRKLTGHILSKAELRALLEWEMHALTDLSLSHLRLGYADVPEVAQMLSGGSWPELSRLDLSRNDLNTDFVLQLIDSEWPKLVDLDLYHNKLQVDGLWKLLGAPHWPILDNLDIGLNLFNGYLKWDVYVGKALVPHALQCFDAKWPGIEISFDLRPGDKLAKKWCLR